jgi:hypothetical protein
MRITSAAALAFLGLMILILGTSQAAGQAAPPQGFAALFNGKDFAGWHGMGHADPRKVWAMTDEERAKTFAASMADVNKNWRIDSGEIVNGGSGQYLTTDKDFADIELLIEYKTVAKADSGVYLRGSPQVQIWDTTEAGGKWKIGADKGSGGLYNNSGGAPGRDPLVLADKPFGEWNALRIIQVGARTTVYLNGKLVVDHAIMENFWDRKLPLFAKGPIQLQTHGGEIRWRNLFIREIPADEANAMLAKKGDEGFAPAFNGKDFDGWAGPLDNYQVQDGAIMCKPGKGGTIYLKQEYGDFTARMEILIPAGGNNGLAIRYPGQGDTAYVGMCELQVLDNDAPQYAKLDARQYHGSAYGMAAAARGYLRPAGQWNFEEVTVKGSTIRVELNGTVILDCDLSKVTEVLANHPHPGKDRTTGFFGFAGHSDPVQFRSIRLKPLGAAK